MTKNPFLNALAALAYIAVIVSIVFYGEKVVGEVQETILLPMAFLSLFVLSAATMGTIFGFRPAQLYLDGEKKAAVNLFFKTLLSFAVLIAIVFGAALLIGKNILG